MLHLSNHTATTLQRLHNEAEDAIKDTVALLPLLDALAPEITQCRHANASQLLVDALRLFVDESVDDKVRRYYSHQYGEVQHVLNAYIAQLSSGGGALSRAVSQWKA